MGENVTGTSLVGSGVQPASFFKQLQLIHFKMGLYQQWAQMKLAGIASCCQNFQDHCGLTTLGGASKKMVQ
jgi:hypothetical protein